MTPEERFQAYHSRLVNKYLHQYRRRWRFWMNYYEARQLVLIALWKACLDFDLSKGTSFSVLVYLYATQAISHEVNRVLKPNGILFRSKASHELIPFSIPDCFKEELEEPISDFLDPITVDIAIETLQIEIELSRKGLRFLEEEGFGRAAHIIEMKIQGKSLDEIGLIYGVCKERVRQITVDGCKRICREFKDTYMKQVFC